MSHRFINLDECDLVGHVGVDSGQMMLGDPCYLDRWGGGEFTSWGEDKEPTGTYDYDGACLASLSDKLAGVLGNGQAVVSATGFGDGQYPVYVEVSDQGEWGRRVKSMTIVFIDDDAEEDEEEFCANCGNELWGFHTDICPDCEEAEQEDDDG